LITGIFCKVLSTNSGIFPKVFSISSPQDSVPPIPKVIATGLMYFPKSVGSAIALVVFNMVSPAELLNFLGFHTNLLLSSVIA
jgi:hypothetical protein